ncbi:hypothetical protein GA0116948_104224 [Chitinophaga costaii]|uniref:Phosphatidate cytidylyltransferase n=1 Tax=Chitinophaga costaii TaxID=1335309 RepID=A0A1C4CNZ0_9BACT|nr:phosphatidate cytidylyltransferase [Chitinophaga costaii]PUZ27014.1 phosphatidate cytidylyltransferase [Chitinophaga costaii]SCC20837.1 hypothetical protein GA0116948_104224 [Chitinophaga costaii]
MKAICFSLLAFSSLLLTSCQAIGDIFKTGVWVGILLVAVVVFVIIWLISRRRS